LRSLFLIYFIAIFVITVSPPLLATKALDKVSLQLQWKHQFEFAGFYAAYEQGYYKQAGLDVEFIEYNGNINIVDAVLSDKAQYGLSYSSIIADYLKGKPLVFIANFFKQSPLAIVASAEIKTPKALIGKKLMGVSNCIDDITLISMLNKFEVNLDDVHNVPATFNIEDFINKEVDAVSVFTSNELFYLQQQGIKYNLFNPTVYGVEYYDVNLFTSRNELIKHPERVQQFKQASIKGWQYALAHKNEIIDLILKKYNTQHKSREALRFEANQIEQLMMPKIYHIGSIDPLRVKLIADSFIQNGFVDKTNYRDIEGFIYQSEKQSLQLTSKEKAFIKQHPKIVLGTEKDWKPYVIVNKDGSISGYDAEVITLINSISGLNLSLKAGNWAKMQQQARTKEIDGLSTGGIHKERKEYLNFSDIYITMSKMVIVAQNNPKNISSLSDLKNKTIAIHKSNIVDQKTAKKFPDSTILPLNKIKQVIAAVITGKADAMFGNGATFYLANELGMPYIKRSVLLENKLELAFGIRKDWPEAISIINKSLNFIGERKLLELKNKWFFSGKNSTINKLLLTKKERTYLAKKKAIKLCVDPHWMPYEQINKNGRYEGIVADIHHILAKRLGVELDVIKTTSWADSINAIKQGKCDILSAATATPERELSMNFSRDYMGLPLVIATQNKVPFIDNISQVSERTFAIVKGHAAAELLLQQYPGLSIVYVDKPSDGLQAVKNNRVFAYIDTPATIAYVIRRDNLVNLKIAGKLKQRYKIAVAVNNEIPILLDIYEKAILSLSNKQLEQTISRWNTIKIVKEFDYQLFGIILSILLIVIALILYRYRIIANYNRQLRSVNRKLELFSMSDQLTGIGNRHAFQTIIKKEFIRIKRYNSTLSLIMLDIDYFKSINDSHGHDVGDRVLKKISLLLSEHIRKVDEIVRWGGEEFIIICPETDISGAIKLAEQLRENIEGSDLGLGKGEITASFGVTQYQNQETIDSLLKKADTALYKAKNNGRNKVMHLKEVVKYNSLHDLLDG